MRVTLYDLLLQKKKEKRKENKPKCLKVAKERPRLIGMMVDGSKKEVKKEVMNEENEEKKEENRRKERRKIEVKKERKDGKNKRKK